MAGAGVGRGVAVSRVVGPKFGPIVGPVFGRGAGERITEVGSGGHGTGKVAPMQPVSRVRQNRMGRSRDNRMAMQRSAFVRPMQRVEDGQPGNSLEFILVQGTSRA
jgi:hypothetical protein